jgi:hypothetical protein
VGDTANWEFAAVVAAVCIGLGGLLLFTLLGALGAWRVHEAASNAATQAARAASAIEELARLLVLPQPAPEPHAPAPVAPDAALARLSETAAELQRLGEQAAELMRQQEALSDAVRNLVQAGVLRGDQSNEQISQIAQTLRRVEEQLVRMTTPR